MVFSHEYRWVPGSDRVDPGLCRVRVKERERDRDRDSESERVCVCACVCVCERERDRERERWGGEGREGMSLNKRHVVGR